MKTNQGSIASLSCYGLDADGLEYRNPVIVALGNSVTAGHFESLFPTERIQIERFLKE